MIAVDVFGGDNAPTAMLEGCALALAKNGDIELMLCGDEKIINDYFLDKPNLSNRITVRNAPGIIRNDEHPTEAIKHKKDSSLVSALMAVADGEAEAFVSAGSTGAVLSGATLLVRRIKGVKRPGLAPLMPAANGGCVLLIDCGANVDSKPQYLHQFAIMGTAYMKNIMGVKNPRIGLLNNGAEEGKGNELVKQVYPMLKEDVSINFVGNCEARDAFSGGYDVIVTDGFAGNVLLKNTEGVAQMVVGMLKESLGMNLRTKLGAALAMPALKRLKKQMDYTEYGGAPLLGINGGIIKAHGSSNGKAFASALKQADDYIKCGVTAAIQSALD